MKQKKSTQTHKCIFCRFLLAPWDFTVFFFCSHFSQYIAGNGYPWQQQIMIRRCTDEQVLLDFCRNNVFLLWDSPFYEFCNGMDTPSELTLMNDYCDDICDGFLIESNSMEILSFFHFVVHPSICFLKVNSNK